MLVSSSLLLEDDAKGMSSMCLCERRWVETDLLQKHCKGQFCHPLCFLGRIDSGVDFDVQVPSSHVHAVPCIRKPWYQMRPLGDAL